MQGNPPVRYISANQKRILIRFGDQDLQAFDVCSGEFQWEALRADGGYRGVHIDFGGHVYEVTTNGTPRILMYEPGDDGTLARAEDGDVNLDAENDDPQGIWSNGTIMWVLDQTDYKIYAYLLRDGSRMPENDFTLATSDGDGISYDFYEIWSDGATMWVKSGADSRDSTAGELGTAIAYDLKTKKRRESRNIYFNNTTHGILAITDTNQGLVFTREEFMAVDNRASTVWAEDADDTTATGTIPLIAIDGAGRITQPSYSALAVSTQSDRISLPAFPLTVIRYIASSSPGPSFGYVSLSASTPQGIWGDESHIWILDGAQHAIRAYVRSSVALGDVAFEEETKSFNPNSIPDEVRRDCRFPSWLGTLSNSNPGSQAERRTVEMLQMDFGPLDEAGSLNPHSIWSDGELMWVLDQQDHMVRAFDVDTQAREADRDIYLSRTMPDMPLNELGGYVSPAGIWGDEAGMLWVAINVDSRVSESAGGLYTFDRTTGEYLPNCNMPDLADVWIEAITGHENTIWVAVREGGILAYDRATGERQAERDISRPTGVMRLGQMWTDGTTLWLTVTTSNAVFQVSVPAQDNNGPYLDTTYLAVPESALPSLELTAMEFDLDDGITGMSLSGGPDAAHFALTHDPGQGSSTRTLAWADSSSPPDFERPMDADGDNLYELEFTITSGAGDRARTSVLCVLVRIQDLVEPPGIVTLYEDSKTYNSISIAWDEPANTGPDISGYDVQFKRDYQVNWSNATLDGDSRTAAYDRNIWPNFTYDFRVRALNDEGTGEWSEPMSITTDPIPRVSATLETAPKLITANTYRTCAVYEGGIQCWGTGPTWSTQHGGLYMAVASAEDHGCGLLSDGTVICWGKTNGAIAPPEGPFMAITAEDGAAVGPIGEFTCGIRPDNTVECWGEETNGAHLPPEDTLFESIDAGPYYVCGVKTDGELACWGSSARWRLDSPDGSYTSVSVGLNNACAVAEDQTLSCWGEKYNDLNTPPAGTFHSVSVGSSHACAVTTDLGVVCWGSNDSGEADVPEGTTAIAVSAGWEYTCAVASDGTVNCWGDSEHQQTDVPEELVVDMPAPEVINLPPYISRADAIVEDGGTTGTEIYVMDADEADDVGTITLSGPDGALFIIDEDQMLVFLTSSDHNNPADADGDNVYEVRVTATSGEGSRQKTAYRDITITVVTQEEISE